MINNFQRRVEPVGPYRNVGRGPEPSDNYHIFFIFLTLPLFIHLIQKKFVFSIFGGQTLLDLKYNDIKFTSNPYQPCLVGSDLFVLVGQILLNKGSEILYQNDSKL